MEERVKSDPSLQRFGNVEGLLSMNRQDVLAQGAANTAQAEATARANLGQAGPAQPPGKQPGPNVAEMQNRQKRIDELRKKLGIDAEQMARLKTAASTDAGRGGLSAEQNELVRLTNAQQSANRTSAASGGPVVTAGGKMIGGAQPGEAQPGQGGGAQGANQQPIRITGTLTVRADGSAIIDADGGVPTNE